MKRKLLILLMLILILSGCSKNPMADAVEDISKYNISYKETFTINGKLNTEWEKMGYKIDSTSCNILQFDTVDKLWEKADYVVVASPKISYSEALQHRGSGQTEEPFESTDLTYSYSVRPFKVNKVYKGEDMKLKEIQVCEHVLTKDNEMRVKPGSYPTQQGTKYILFLFRANTEEEQYFPLLYQGKYSLNDSDNKEQKNISQDMYKQVKEKFKDEIK